MGSRQTFSKFTNIEIANASRRSTSKTSKIRAKIWGRILLGSLSLFIAEPTWSETIAPDSDVAGSHQAFTTLPLPAQPPRLILPSGQKSALKREPECPKNLSTQACDIHKATVSLAESAPSLNNQGSSISQPTLDAATFSKSRLTFSVDSHRASDLASPQMSLEEASLEGMRVETKPSSDHPLPSASSWAIARDVITPLQPGTLSSRPNDFSQEPYEQPSANSLLAQETPSTNDSSTSSEALSVEDCPLDPDLGCLRIPLPTAPAPTPAPVLLLIPKFDFFHSNNILSAIDPVNDGLMRPSLTLLAVPSLGPNTYLVASVEGAFNRYFRISEFNYNELRVRAGIFQRLSPNMTGEIGWTNQQLFISGNKIPGFPSGTRFLNDHAIRLELSRRDQLAERLSLSSFYQLRVGFAQPEDRSRILNVVFLSLNHELTPSIQLGLDYQFAAANFTVAPRTDIYHQILGRVTFNAFRNTQLSVYGGFSFGNSTVPNIDFNSYVVGVSLSVNLVLF